MKIFINADSHSILNVIEDQYDNKGILIDAYGEESNYPGDQFQEFLLQISQEEREEYNFD